MERFERNLRLYNNILEDIYSYIQVRDSLPNCCETEISKLENAIEKNKGYLTTFHGVFQELLLTEETTKSLDERNEELWEKKHN
jgi:uncharacterized protein YjaG (DUF416 family)